MREKHVKELFERYMTRQASPDEEEELMSLLAGHVSSEERAALVEEWFDRVPETCQLSREAADRIFRRVVGSGRRFRWRLAAAAGIALLLAAGGYFSLSKFSRPADPVALVDETDLLPGDKRAVLVLADGSRVPLDTTREGQVARDGNVSVVQRDNGVTYETLPGETPAPGANTHLLLTPNGSYYEMTLPDGSRAWLNAASSIRYPPSFAGGSRRVTITGEVYFEVEPRVDALTRERLPFIVSVGDRAEVEVLGTRFNVNGYEDEGEIKATLLEGSVRFRPLAGAPVLLEPGEQARLEADGTLRVLPVNTREVMAWKEGKFMFDRADIRAITRQLGRWYDVEVEYRGEVTSHFGGTISRDVNISKVFHILEQTGSVKFSMEGHKVIVTP
jgi:ferric-dicitrate binding protein FerR (iron transport regulator)